MIAIAAQTSEVPNFKNLPDTKGALLFLSTKRSGSNLISASLGAITRKPVSWLSWGERVFEPDSKFKNHPSYNRLNLPLISHQPLMYRTHFDLEKLKQIPSHLNKLIFVTRNPKELLFREFALTKPDEAAPDHTFIEEFFEDYFAAFDVYEMWDPDNRFLVFYEDFISNSNQILIHLLSFMRERALFFDDYQMNREKYLSLILKSYKTQHAHNRGGSSSANGPTDIYHTQNRDPKILSEIDIYLEKKAPLIWEKYLKRFETKLPNE